MLRSLVGSEMCIRDRSSGGKMVFNEELNKDIPEKWEVSDLITGKWMMAEGVYSIAL